MLDSNAMGERMIEREMNCVHRPIALLHHQVTLQVAQAQV
jgi:hypothetical protein